MASIFDIKKRKIRENRKENKYFGINIERGNRKKEDEGGWKREEIRKEKLKEKIMHKIWTRDRYNFLIKKSKK